MSLANFVRALLVCGVALAGEAAADPYPSKPTKIYLGFAPGGGTGTIARPFAAIRPHYFSTQEDRTFFVLAIRKPRALPAIAPIDRIVSEEYQPGASVTSDESVLDYVRSKAGSIDHPCGTCRMGADDASVVDPRLRVRGIGGLRLADASKAADLIVADNS